ncbi:hypothetical protein KKC45_04400 [Patescibacteria group bacterium]|nr:hypothetical protein [Patescibacteria group bacterium]
MTLAKTNSPKYFFERGSRDNNFEQESKNNETSKDVAGSQPKADTARRRQIKQQRGQKALPFVLFVVLFASPSADGLKTREDEENVFYTTKTPHKCGVFACPYTFKESVLGLARRFRRKRLGCSSS